MTFTTVTEDMGSSSSIAWWLVFRDTMVSGGLSFSLFSVGNTMKRDYRKLLYGFKQIQSRQRLAFQSMTGSLQKHDLQKRLKIETLSWIRKVE